MGLGIEFCWNWAAPVETRSFLPPCLGTRAAAPPATELPPKKACSSSRRRVKVNESIFSAKTANLPERSVGSTIKRTRGLPTKT